MSSVAISASDVKALRDATGAGMMDCKKALSEADGDTEKAIEVLRERGLAKAGKRAGRATSEGSIAIALDGGVSAIVDVGCETDFVAKTDTFQGLAQEVADAVAADASVESAEQALKAKLGDGSVEDRVAAIASQVGENVQVKQAARVVVESGVGGGYVHAGGKLGVIVGLSSAGSGAKLEALAKDIAMHVAANDPTPLAVDRDSLPEAAVTKEREFQKKQALDSGKPENIVDKMVEGRMAKYYQEYCLLEQPFVKDSDRSVRKLLEDLGGEIGSEISVAGFVRFKVGEGDSE
jgi:elongation factor Ts